MCVSVSSTLSYLVDVAMIDPSSNVLILIIPVNLGGYRMLIRAGFLILLIESLFYIAYGRPTTVNLLD